MNTPKLSRREFMQTQGALIVGASGSVFVGDALAQAVTPVVIGPQPTALDTWIRIATNGHVTANFGKMDCGQGLDTAIAQIVAEELDVSMDSVTVVMGDTRLTPNQGGGSGSTGLRMGSNPLRNAAAEARRLLVESASVRLGVPASELATENGRVFVKANTAQSVSYADLIGGKDFGASLKWNNAIGNGMDAKGMAKPKDVSQYKIVGQGIKRKDIADKVGAVEHYTAHIRPDNLLHARAVRPPVAGAVPVSVDAASIADIPGAKHFVKGGFVAVLADTEWNAVRAARQLKVTWSDAQPSLGGGEGKVFDYIRTAPVTASNAIPIFGGKKAYDTHAWPRRAAWSMSKATKCRFGLMCKSRIICAKALPSSWASRKRMCK
jgi:CO/xanthine dehydrogenase Mo-binding subunit